MLRKDHVLTISVIVSIFVILVSVYDNPVFAPSHPEFMGNHMMGQHHFPHHGMCAPGFASLGEICVLNDRCGPGAYAGRVCMMDGIMQPYLRPLHQKHAGISVDNIICAEGKHLMFKSHNAAPACINSDSLERLKHRGWQTAKPDLACTLEYNPVCGMDGVTYGNPCMMHSEHMAMRHSGECMDSTSITNFEECIAAGNPAMESHPRQCNTKDGKHFVEIISGQQQCENEGGQWGIWGNAVDSSESCNASTSDERMECTDSAQCQSYCQAMEGSEIDSESTGMCYGYELAICMQEVQNGMVQPEWCQ